MEANGSYQKYALNDLPKTGNDEYQITKVHFIDELNGNAGQTYNTNIVCTAVFDDTLFSYQQQNLYNITLKGENFRTIFQFNKDNNAFVDLWSHLIADTEKLDLDKRAFFYFAFNCYDEARDIKFVPDDILQLEVKYTQLIYEYTGNDKDASTNIEPISKEITQTIEPDNVKVIAADDKRSNKRIYEYSTINRLSEADLSKNADSNQELLKQVAKEWDWAVQFGNSKGYAEKHTEAGLVFNKTYDINYTEVKDFQTISITYQYEHKTIKCPTNSLVNDSTVTIHESVRSATAEEKKQYAQEVILQNPNKNRLEKGIDLIWLWLEPLFVKIALAGLVLIILDTYFPPIHKLRKRLWKKIKKFHKKKGKHQK